MKRTSESSHQKLHCRRHGESGARSNSTLRSRWSRGRYHGGRRPSSDDSFHCLTVTPPSALDKPSIMKLYHRRRTCSHISPRRSPTIHDTRFVECRWWNDAWTVRTVVTWRSSASIIPAPEHEVDAGDGWREEGCIVCCMCEGGGGGGGGGVERTPRYCQQGGGYSDTNSWHQVKQPAASVSIASFGWLSRVR